MALQHGAMRFMDMAAGCRTAGGSIRPDLVVVFFSSRVEVVCSSLSAVTVLVCKTGFDNKTPLYK